MGAVEGFKEMGEILLGNADAVIGDHQGQLVFVAGDVEGDRLVGQGIFQGVGQKIGQDMANDFGID